MKAIDRLYIYLEYKDIKPTTFEREIGFSSGYLSKQKSRGSDLGESVLKQINDYCHDLSLVWLLIGEGEMIRPQHVQDYIKENVLKNDKPDDKADDKASTQKEKKLIPNKTIEATDTIEIPIVEISAAAGYGYMSSDYIEKSGVIQLPSNMVKSGLHYCIRIKGHSMTPTLQDGDFAVVRHLNRSEWGDMRDEHVYLVVDKDGLAVIKRIKNRFKKGFIVLMSDNIDKSNYPNYNLQEDEVHNIFHAEWYFSAKMDNINNLYYNRVKAVEDRLDEIENKLDREIK